MDSPFVTNPARHAAVVEALDQHLAAEAGFPMPYSGMALFTAPGVWSTVAYALIFRWFEPSHCRKRVTFDLYLGKQVQSYMEKNARKVFAAEMPANEPIVAAMRTWPGEESCAYLTPSHLYLQTYANDSLAGQLKATATGKGMRRSCIPLASIRSVTVKPGGIVSSSMRIEINGEDHGGMFAGWQKRNAPALEGVIRKAAQVAGG